MDARELLVFGAITIVCFVAAMIMDESLRAYPLLCGIISLMFLIYLIFKDKKVELFDEYDYDCLFDHNFIESAVRENDNSVTAVYLTGEDRFPMKKLGDCSGHKVFTAPINEDKKTLLLHVFMVQYYSLVPLKSLIQHVVPHIPVLNVVLMSLPFNIGSFFFPSLMAVLTYDYQCSFKRDIVEINGLSLTPLRTSPVSNGWFIVEYMDKQAKEKDLELWTINYEIMKDKFISDYIRMRNSMDIITRFNPKTRLDQETGMKLTK